MTKGVLIISHNSRDIDYSLLSIISGGLAKKNLGVPVSLATDEPTIQWMKDSNTFDLANTIFENIITIDRPATNNQRVIFDGKEGKRVPFINSSRSLAYDITPYDRTLLIDSDFLIMSDSLNKYWDVDVDLMIGEKFVDIRGDRFGESDKYVSDVGVHLYWATTVMFSKSEESRVFWNLLKYVQENYDYYADIYRYPTRTFRNDISFSVAKHIMDGFMKGDKANLPEIFTILDKDDIFDVKENRIDILIEDRENIEKYFATSIKNKDVHVMNKQSIIRNKDKFLEIL